MNLKVKKLYPDSKPALNRFRGDEMFDFLLE